MEQYYVVLLIQYAITPKVVYKLIKKSVIKN